MSKGEQEDLPGPRGSDQPPIPAEPIEKSGAADKISMDLKARLCLSQKMEILGRLIGGVAHEFNNMLTVIGGYSEMLKTCINNEDHLQGIMIGEIQKAADTGASFTRQLLAFSRKNEVALEILDLGTIVSDMEKMLRMLVDKRVELRTAIAPTATKIRADAGHLEQVLVNLVLNARDAVNQGGQIKIETATVQIYEEEHQIGLKPGCYCTLMVSDTGCGMDMETQKHIFEPFFTTKAPGQGTGLGLCVVWDIVQQHGGLIQVASEPGEGTTVKIYFPKSEEK